MMRSLNDSHNITHLVTKCVDHSSFNYKTCAFYHLCLKKIYDWKKKKKEKDVELQPLKAGDLDFCNSIL